MASLREISKKVVSDTAQKFIQFVNRGPSPYHVVEECKRMLVGAGFSELKERDTWTIEPGNRYFFINNFSTIIAFAVGGKYKPGNGFTIVGAHTDSPCLKVKPRSSRQRCGYIGVAVECYGGGIWHTWFDRDLKLAGRVMIKSSNGLDHKLVHIDKPILKIPNICIHLAHADVHKAFSPNKETHIVPVLATQAAVQLEGSCSSAVPECSPPSTAHNHHPLLIKLLADALQCEPTAIMDFELCLADAFPAVIGGALDEFIFAPRIDNLINCYTSLEGLIGSLETLSNDTNVRMVTLFDNEEVGSTSAQGANSSLLEFALRRIAAGGSATAFEESIPKSFLVSADQAHGVHPNYPEKHEQNHQPMLHEGIVLKFNANQRYASTAITAAILREVASRYGVPMQEVVVRNDSHCGSTIGPMLSAKLGVRTVDIGTAQLSMHSIREMCCTTGVVQAAKLFESYFSNFTDVDSNFNKQLEQV